MSDPVLPPKRRAILVADDHAMFRSGLRTLLADEFPAFDVLEAGDLEEALDVASAASGLALVVVDLSMPGMNGAESIAAVVDGFPEARVVVMTASESRTDVLAALDAGAMGFVPKSLDSDATRDAIAAILRGESYVPAKLMLAGRRGTAPAPRPMAPGAAQLTPRQRDVGRLLAQGMSTKEIARALSLGEGTVKIYLAGLYRVLGARNRLDASIRARDLLG